MGSFSDSVDEIKVDTALLPLCDQTIGAGNVFEAGCVVKKLGP